MLTLDRFICRIDLEQERRYLPPRAGDVSEEVDRGKDLISTHFEVGRAVLGIITAHQDGTDFDYRGDPFVRLCDLSSSADTEGLRLASGTYAALRVQSLSFKPHLTDAPIFAPPHVQLASQGKPQIGVREVSRARLTNAHLPAPSTSR